MFQASGSRGEKAAELLGAFEDGKVQPRFRRRAARKQLGESFVEPLDMAACKIGIQCQQFGPVGCMQQPP